VKIVGVLGDNEFTIIGDKDGVKIESEIKDTIGSLGARVFNPNSMRTYTATVSTNIIDAYLVLKKLEKEEIYEIEIEKAPKGLIEEPIEKEIEGAVN